MKVPWDDAFDRTLRAHLPLLPAGAALTEETDLAEAGLDSLPLIELVVQLEERYAVTVPGRELAVGAFATPRTVWELVCRLRRDSQLPAPEQP